MAGPDPRAVIAVKIFMEEDQITPVLILLKLLRSPIEGPASIRSPQKNVDETARQLGCHFIQGLHMTGASGVFNLILVAKIVMELLERLDD